MSKPADIGGKRLISLAPDNWAQWLTQLPQARVQEKDKLWNKVVTPIYWKGKASFGHIIKCSPFIPEARDTLLFKQL